MTTAEISPLLERDIATARPSGTMRNLELVFTHADELRGQLSSAERDWFASDALKRYLRKTYGMKVSSVLIRRTLQKMRLEKLHPIHP